MFDISTAPKDQEILVFGILGGEIHSPRPDAKPSWHVACWVASSDYEGFNWAVTGSDGYASWVKAEGWLPRPPPQVSSREGEAWQPIETAPKDGTLLKLFVDYSEGDNPLEDAERAWTIGFNNLANDEEDRWKFAGWNWCQDCFTEGRGQVIGWLPFHAPPGNVSTLPRQGFDVPEELRVAAELARDQALRLSKLLSDPQWKATRSHVEASRNILRDLATVALRVASPSDAVPDAVGDLIEALRPFANAAEAYAHSGPDAQINERPGWAGKDYVETYISASDLRRARAALARASSREGGAS